MYQAKKDSLYGNLKLLSYEINKLLNLPNSFVFNSYEEAFDSIIKYAKNERFIIAIYEYPYIIKQDESFPSKLKREYYLFSKSGFDENLMKLDTYKIHFYSLDDLFKL